MTQRKKPTAKTTAKNAAARSKNSSRKQAQNQGRSTPFYRLTWFKTFAILCVFALCGMSWQALYRPLAISSTSRILQIKSGQTYSGLINNLSQRNMVRFAFIVKIYQRLFIHSTLKAGSYEIPVGINASQLLRRLNNGQLVQLNRVLLVEGMTFNQLKQRLEANEEIKKTVLQLPNDQILAAAGIPEQNPEGWFAPDTYFFEVGETDVNVLKKLYEKQNTRLEKEWISRAPDLPYHSMDDALTMASIVEKETGVGGERSKVAAVFVNRLKQGMRLQTDPTVIYGMGEQYDGHISKKDLETRTPYNTYLINGLPPTPIAMPGLASIHAALHPADISALYFVATGMGGHKFSDSLAEHNAAVQQYLQVMRTKRDSE